MKLNREEADVIGNEYITDDNKLEAIKRALERELKNITDTILTKKRKDTQVYKNLEYEQARVMHELSKVNEARA